MCQTLTPARVVLGRGSAGRSGVGGRVGNGKNELVSDTLPKWQGRGSTGRGGGGGGWAGKNELVALQRREKPRSAAAAA